MDTNRYFSFSRVGWVMKRDLMENWKKHVYNFLALYGGCLVLIVANLGAYSGEANTFAHPDSSFGTFADTVIGVVGFMALLGSLLVASRIMECMDCKEKRVSYLMLPATMAEKFVSRALLVMFGFALTMCVAFLMAEGTRYLLLPMYDLPDTFHRSLLTHINVRMEWADTTQGIVAQLNGLLFMFVNYSLFVLGGNYWYKNSFIKTLATLVVISLVGALLFGQVVMWIGEANFDRLGEWLEANCTWLETISVEAVLGVIALLQILFILFLWWMSYLLFTRSQVIKPKFRLL